MPLPAPRADESEDAFLARCMNDPVMEEEFPDEDQRYAVCAQQWQDKDARIKLTIQDVREMFRGLM